MKQRIDSLMGIESVVIPNFVPQPEQAPTSSEISDFILYAGVLEKHKGVELLVEWYNEAGAGLPALVIVGAGPLQSRIDHLVRKFHLSERIIRLGWVERDRLLGLMASSKALVLPSIAPENAPLVALEALSLGTPVVGSNRGGLPEITSKVDEKLTFSWELRGDIGRSIRYALEEKRLKDKARNVYRESYSPEAFITSYMELLAETNHGQPLSVALP
jgi:glycosyltransferase involved in cell wall biosynthesis